MKVSVLLLTFNEAANLPRCLDALAWCDDVVVLDSGSVDETRAIALARGVRVLERPFDDFAGQRNWGLDNGAFRHDWVLHIDADEVVTPAFVAALDLLEPPPGIDAYNVPSKLMLFNVWLRRAGMYPVYQVRIGRRGALRFRQVGHGQREDLAPERVGVFSEPYLHYSFSQGLAAWFVRHVRYARDEAALLIAERGRAEPFIAGIVSGDTTRRRRALKALSARAPLGLRPLLRFVYIYLIKRGFLDGFAGFVYAGMLTIYEGMTCVLAFETMRSTRRIAAPTEARP